MKIINLSRSETGIFQTLKKAPDGIISHEEIKGLFPEIKPGSLNHLLSSLSKKGFLYPLKKGLYLVQEEPSNKPLINDPLVIGSRIFSGYLGFSSALRLYDLLDYEPFTVFVVSARRSILIQVGEYSFKCVYMGEKAVGQTLYKGLYVSTKAKTFFDCFLKPQYAGGYSNVAQALYLNKGIDWEEFRKYYESYASSSLMQRTGYVLELLKEETGKNIPEKVISFLGSNAGDKTRLIPNIKAKGVYAADWRLTDNEGKEKIMSWWR
jgi:predicted transcriptional regulator of viral defense system